MVSRLAPAIQKFQRFSLEVKLLLLLVATLPFDYIPSREVAGVTVRLSTIFGLLLIVTTWLRYRWQPLQSLGRRTSTLIVALLAWLLLNAALAYQPRQALPATGALLFLIVLMLAVAHVARYVQPRVLVGAVLAGAAVAGLFGIYQITADFAGWPESLTGLRPEYSWRGFGFPRLQGPALEPLYFSCYLLLPIGILVSGLLRDRSYWRWSRLALLALLLVCDVLTLSRGGLLALVVLLAVSFALRYRRGFVRTHLRQLVVATAAGLAVCIVGLAGLGLVARQGQDSDLTYGTSGLGTIWAHLTNTRLTANEANRQRDDSIHQREVARNQAIEVLKSSPRVWLIGIGPGQYEQ
jgi:O-antigen ligase